MRVLLVEDDGDSRTILRTMIEVSSHAVVDARTGTEALRLAREHPLDAIQMELEVPGMNDWDATRALGQSPRTVHPPVIPSPRMCSRSTGSGRGRRRAAYLAKPILPRRVIGEVERIIRAGAAD